MFDAQRGLIALRNGFVALIVALALWELAAQIVGNRMLMPSLPELLGELARVYQAGSLWPHAGASLLRFLAGYGAAVIVGIPLGFALARTPPLRLVLGTLASGLAAVPWVMFAPLMVLWFGVGSESKIALAFAAAIFPIASTIMRGLANGESFAPPDIVQASTPVRPVNGAACVVAALRMALVPAVGVVIVGEIVASTAGIGLVLMNAAAALSLGALFAALLLVAVPVAVVHSILLAVETRLAAA